MTPPHNNFTFTALIFLLYFLSFYISRQLRVIFFHLPAPTFVLFQKTHVTRRVWRLYGGNDCFRYLDQACLIANMHHVGYNLIILSFKILSSKVNLSEYKYIYYFLFFSILSLLLISALKLKE